MEHLISDEIGRMQGMFLERFNDINGRIDSLVQDQRSVRDAIMGIQRQLEEHIGEHEKQALKIQIIENRLDSFEEKIMWLNKTVSELKSVPVKRDAEITQTVKKWIIGAVGASVTAGIMAAIAKIAGLIK
jgi:chromosome segregation ATPase